MVKAVIFDFFGVFLVDADKKMVSDVRSRDPAGAQSMGDAMRAYDLGLTSLDELSEVFAEHTGLAASDIKLQLGAARAVLDEQLCGYTRQLRGRGFKTALLSNTGLESIRRFMDGGQLSELFDAVVLSYEVGIVKPDPKIFELALEKLGVEPKEAIFIDDRSHNVEAARALGMKAILFENLPQMKTELEALLADSDH